MKKIITKIIFLIVVFSIFEICGLYINPLVENGLAINQMYNTIESNLLVQVYDYISNYTLVFGILLVLFVFRKELSKLYKKVKESFNDQKEKENEQI